MMQRTYETGPGLQTFLNSEGEMWSIYNSQSDKWNGWDGDGEKKEERMELVHAGTLYWNGKINNFDKQMKIRKAAAEGGLNAELLKQGGQ